MGELERVEALLKAISTSKAFLSNFGNPSADWLNTWKKVIASCPQQEPGSVRCGAYMLAFADCIVCMEDKPAASSPTSSAANGWSGVKLRKRVAVALLQLANIQLGLGDFALDGADKPIWSP
mmetsp:Transcript_16565/g.52810  ORF Transcript_16565/g.52810 Transcript_16565/m.52810 type:complete len:122 (-) Transcript_16565:250-615(-)